MILSVYKPIGATPLQMIKQVREEYPEYAHEKISYAGRLDPLAHGVLLLTIGEGIQKRAQLLDLPKTYTFQMLLGIATDSYDLLGMITKKGKVPSQQNVRTFVNSFVSSHLGTFEQQYPPFSSKPVQGKPLFWWAKQKKLEEIQIPVHAVAIYSLQMITRGSMTSDTLQNLINQRIGQVSGDFRQEEILAAWHAYFTEHKESNYQVLTFSVSCSSGTYVRGLVHEFGEKLGCGAIALDICRTAVGDYKQDQAMRTRSS